LTLAIPGYSYLNGLGGTGYDWQYQTVPQVDSGGGRKGWPRGKGLGGSGAINGLYWCRAAADEYDAWDREWRVGIAVLDMISIDIFVFLA
jgi:choline dehydrogenase-like flavoprotein